MRNIVFFQAISRIIKFIMPDITFWDTWKWKMDPFIIKKNTDFYDILIDLTGTKKDAVPVKLLREEKAGFFSHNVYSTDNGDYVWQYERIKNGEIILKYLVSSDFKQIELLKDNSSTAGGLAFEYLGQILPVVLLKDGILNFHGVLMEYAGKGIIISASSGTGKTTHARMWRNKQHALIINGDRSVCKKIDNIWTGFGLPWSGTSGEQINRSVPVNAMVILERSEENYAEILTGLEAFAGALPNIQYPRWDEKLMRTVMDLADDFLSEIPVIRLCCRPDEDAVDVLKVALESL